MHSSPFNFRHSAASSRKMPKRSTPACAASNRPKGPEPHPGTEEMAKLLPEDDILGKVAGLVATEEDIIAILGAGVSTDAGIAVCSSPHHQPRHTDLIRTTVQNAENMGNAAVMQTETYSCDLPSQQRTAGTGFWSKPLLFVMLLEGASPPKRTSFSLRYGTRASCCACTAKI